MERLQIIDKMFFQCFWKFGISMLIYISFNLHGICTKIKIPHKGCYFTCFNIVMKTQIFFSCKSVDETNENIHTSCNTYTNLENIKLYFFYLMAAIFQ